jgi:hypothetical protein
MIKKLLREALLNETANEITVFHGTLQKHLEKIKYAGLVSKNYNDPQCHTK